MSWATEADTGDNPNNRKSPSICVLTHFASALHWGHLSPSHPAFNDLVHMLVQPKWFHPLRLQPSINSAIVKEKDITMTLTGTGENRKEMGKEVTVRGSWGKLYWLEFCLMCKRCSATAILQPLRLWGSTQTQLPFISSHMWGLDPNPSLIVYKCSFLSHMFRYF